MVALITIQQGLKSEITEKIKKKSNKLKNKQNQKKRKFSSKSLRKTF